MPWSICACDHQGTKRAALSSFTGFVRGGPRTRGVEEPRMEFLAWAG
jgi:hypothetical protein